MRIFVAGATGAVGRHLVSAPTVCASRPIGVPRPENDQAILRGVSPLNQASMHWTIWL